MSDQERRLSDEEWFARLASETITGPSAPWTAEDEELLQQKRDAAASRNGRAPTAATVKASTDIPRLVLRDPRHLKPKRIEFLDDSYRHPIGMTTLLVGDGGLGKSLYSIYLAAKTTRAGFAVVFASAEDDAEKTWLPRLLAAGADLRLVRMVRIERSVDGLDWDESIQLPGSLRALKDELDALEREEGCEVRLLVIDPLESHLSDTNDDGNSSTKRRQALAPLEAFANREDLHVLVIHHINKDSSQKASHRVLGTIANRNAPRSMLLFGLHPDDGDQRVLYHDKHNVSEKSPTQVYAVEKLTVRDDNRATIPTARLVYLRDSDDLDADAILGGRSRREDDGDRGAVDEAVEFLLTELADGSMLVSEVERDAEDLGISRAALKRARKRLGIKPRRSGGIADKGAWKLQLPGDEQTEAEVADDA